MIETMIMGMELGYWQVVVLQRGVNLLMSQIVSDYLAMQKGALGGK